jgi:hypothetical protein
VGVKFELTGGTQLARAFQIATRYLQKGASVKVGFLEGVHYSDTHPIRGTARKPLLVALVAFWNEFGTTRAPARPFFRTTIAKKSSEWGTILGKAMVYYKGDSGKALAALGTVMQSDIRSSIVNWSTPPNAPRTVKIKGFNDPLIDDGTMQRVVNYKVMQ